MCICKNTALRKYHICICVCAYTKGKEYGDVTVDLSEPMYAYCVCICTYILPATGSSQAISTFAGMYRSKGPDLCCAQTQGMRRTHALPAPHHKSNLTLPIDAVPSQTKRVIYLRVRERTNARRRSQSGLPQRSRKQKQTKATKAALP